MLSDIYDFAVDPMSTWEIVLCVLALPFVVLEGFLSRDTERVTNFVEGLV